MPQWCGINKLFLFITKPVTFGCSEEQIIGLFLPFPLFYLYFCLFFAKIITLNFCFSKWHNTDIGLRKYLKCVFQRMIDQGSRCLKKVPEIPSVSNLQNFFNTKKSIPPK